MVSLLTYIALNENGCVHPSLAGRITSAKRGARDVRRSGRYSSRNTAAGSSRAARRAGR